MRRTLTVLSAVAVLVGAGAATASAAVNFESGAGSGPQPAALGPYSMVPLSADATPEGTLVTSVSSPIGSIQFGLPVMHYLSTPGGWWGGWNAPAGDVYFTGYTTSTMTLTLPPGTGAVDFYGQTQAAGTFRLTARKDGKVIGRVRTTWPNGAKYLGFWVPLTQEIDSITISAPDDAFGFGIGTMRIARSTDRGPVLDSMSQASGSTAGGDELTIRGQNFTDGTGVLFGGTPASSVTVVDYSTLKVVTPAHAPGAVDVTIVNRNGNSQQVDADAFTFTG